jgi:hypothetical protein
MKKITLLMCIKCREIIIENEIEKYRTYVLRGEGGEEILRVNKSNYNKYKLSQYFDTIADSNSHYMFHELLTITIK